MQPIIVDSRRLNWTRSRGFSLRIGGFPHKNYGVWFIFLLDEFIYLLLLVDIAYLVLHKEMVEKFWCLLEYCEFTLTPTTTPSHFHCNLVLFTFILQVLLALLDLKFQNEPNFVFQAYPKTIKAAVASLLVFALKVEVDFTFHSSHLSPTCSYLLSTNIMLCGSLLVASLASLLFPNTCRPLIYLIYLLLSLGN